MTKFIINIVKMTVCKMTIDTRTDKMAIDK
jgi:hypothetical protein